MSATTPNPKRPPWLQRQRRLLVNEYRYAWDDIKDYFSRYGGWGEVLRSPFTHLAALVTLLGAHSWLGAEWSNIPVTVLPALLGFALAAYALLLAFGDERFRAFLAVPPAERELKRPVKSLLLSVSAIFLQFVIIQVIALLLAVVANTHPLHASMISTIVSSSDFLAIVVRVLRDVYCCFAFFMFTLSLTTSGAAALNIYHATKWYVDFTLHQRGLGAPPEQQLTTLTPPEG